MGKGRRSSKRPLQQVLGQGADVNAGNPLEVHDPKVGSLISYEGVTTADGAADGSSLIDSVLTTKANFNGNLVIITSGAYAGQGSDIIGATTGGTVTAHDAFDGQILRGTSFVIVALKLTPAEVAALTVLVTAIKVSTDKMAGEAVVNGTQSKNWNAAEQNLVSLGAATTKYKLHSLIVDISQLTDTATIDIRLYMNVNGVERNLYDQPFVVGTDPDGCWIVNGTLGIHDILRVACQSNNAGDDGKAIAYSYMLEAM